LRDGCGKRGRLGLNTGDGVAGERGDERMVDSFRNRASWEHEEQKSALLRKVKSR